LWGFEEAKPAFRLGLSFLSGEHRLGRYLALVPCVRCEDTTALLVDACPMVREPRHQCPGDRGDERGGLCPRAGSPPLPIAWREADGTVVEKRGRQACHKTRERLLGLGWVMLHGLTAV
jgi:hypothetical protein